MNYYLVFSVVLFGICSFVQGGAICGGDSTETNVVVGQTFSGTLAATNISYHILAIDASLVARIASINVVQTSGVNPLNVYASFGTCPTTLTQDYVVGRVSYNASIFSINYPVSDLGNHIIGIYSDLGATYTITVTLLINSIPLTNYVPLQMGTKGTSFIYFTITIPSNIGSASVEIRTTSTSSIYIYAKLGAQATSSSYDYTTSVASGSTNMTLNFCSSGGVAGSWSFAVSDFYGSLSNRKQYTITPFYNGQDPTKSAISLGQLVTSVVNAGVINYYAVTLDSTYVGGMLNINLTEISTPYSGTINLFVSSSSCPTTTGTSSYYLNTARPNGKYLLNFYVPSSGRYIIGVSSSLTAGFSLSVSSGSSIIPTPLGADSQFTWLTSYSNVYFSFTTTKIFQIECIGSYGYSIYLRNGAVPTSSVYDATKSWSTTDTNLTVTECLMSPGTWNIMVNRYTSYSNFNLRLVETPNSTPSTLPLSFGVAATGTAPAGSYTYFSLASTYISSVYYIKLSITPLIATDDVSVYIRAATYSGGCPTSSSSTFSQTAQVGEKLSISFPIKNTGTNLIGVSSTFTAAFTIRADIILSGVNNTLIEGAQEISALTTSDFYIYQFQTTGSFVAELSGYYGYAYFSNGYLPTTSNYDRLLYSFPTASNTTFDACAYSPGLWYVGMSGGVSSFYTFSIRFFDSGSGVIQTLTPGVSVSSAVDDISPQSYLFNPSMTGSSPVISLTISTTVATSDLFVYLRASSSSGCASNVNYDYSITYYTATSRITYSYFDLYSSYSQRYAVYSNIGTISYTLTASNYSNSLDSAISLNDGLTQSGIMNTYGGYMYFYVDAIGPFSITLSGVSLLYAYMKKGDLPLSYSYDGMYGYTDYTNSNQSVQSSCYYSGTIPGRWYIGVYRSSSTTTPFTIQAALTGVPNTCIIACDLTNAAKCQDQYYTCMGKASTNVTICACHSSYGVCLVRNSCGAGTKGYNYWDNYQSSCYADGCSESACNAVVPPPPEVSSVESIRINTFVVLVLSVITFFITL